MVVVLAPAVDKICESFTHNLLSRDQGNPNLLYLMGIYKECISNARKFESDFWGSQHGCVCVAMGKQQYAIHSHIEFVSPRKPGCSPTNPLNTTRGNIAVSYQQYQNNLHDYHLIKNMISVLKQLLSQLSTSSGLRGIRHDDGVREQVLHGVDELAIHVVLKNHSQKSNAESIQY